MNIPGTIKNYLDSFFTLFPVYTQLYVFCFLTILIFLCFCIIYIISSRVRKNYLDNLIKLYPTCQHDSNISEIEKKYDGKKTTYGEMDYNGVKELYEIAKSINKKINTFIDIGSGRGKLCFFMASYDEIKKSIGIELVTDRHNDALELQDRLEKEYAGKVKLINSDIFDFNLDSNLPDHPQVFAWFSNLCFDEIANDDVFLKFEKELPEGSILCCSRSCGVDIKFMKFVKSVQIDMSWGKANNVYIYIKGNRGVQ